MFFQKEVFFKAWNGKHFFSTRRQELKIKSRQRKIAFGETSLSGAKSIPNRHISLVEFQAIQALFSTAEDLIKIGSFWLNGGEGLVDKDLINESKSVPILILEMKLRLAVAILWEDGESMIIESQGKKSLKEFLSLTGFTGPTLMIDYSKKLVVAIMHSYLHPKRKDEEGKLN